MRATVDHTRQDGYVITELGRHDLIVTETCHCNPRLAGLLIECPDCGTIYGSLRDSMDRGQGRDRKG